MSKHSLKDWLIAVRPWSFPASAMPVLVTLVYLYWAYDAISWVNGLLALVSMIFFQASGNAWSDYFDFEKGVDRADTFGIKTLTSGQFMPREIRNLGLGLLVPAVGLGLWLMMRTGLPLLWIGLCGVACSLFYPWLKYRAFGDAVIFVDYGILPTLGTCYVALGVFLPDVLLIMIPVGLITVAILHANNTRDVKTDARAGIATLAMKAGMKTSIFLYLFEVLFPHIWVAACVLLGYFPWWSLLVLITLPPAVANVRAMLRLPAEGIDAISNLDEKTAKYQLMFSLLLTISFLI